MEQVENLWYGDKIVVYRTREEGKSAEYSAVATSICVVEDVKSQNEFRKKACKRHVDKILIYSTTPIMKVVGEAEVEDVLIDEPEVIWKKTEKKSGIDKNFFDKYYENREQAVAYKLKNVIAYQEPRELKEYGIACAPQLFQYVEA